MGRRRPENMPWKSGRKQVQLFIYGPYLVVGKHKDLHFLTAADFKLLIQILVARCYQVSFFV